MANFVQIGKKYCGQMDERMDIEITGFIRS